VKALSKVFKPRTQLPTPTAERVESAPVKIIQKLPKKKSLEQIFVNPFKRKIAPKGDKRGLINHNNYSQTNFSIKQQFEKIMSNEKMFEFNLSNSRSR
jgi:hypothetical protein